MPGANRDSPFSWAKFLQKRCSKNLVEFPTPKNEAMFFWGLKFWGSPNFLEIVCHRTPNGGKLTENQTLKSVILQNPQILP